MMVASLTTAGIVEARLWQSDTSWLESVRAARMYWLLRSLSAIPITAGFIALALGLTTGSRGSALPEIGPDVGLDPLREAAPVFAPVGGPT
jgi:cytochrome c oxidase cbb3-type subunit 1